jgi:hypothetical protein
VKHDAETQTKPELVLANKHKTAGQPGSTETLLYQTLLWKINGKKTKQLIILYQAPLDAVGLDHDEGLLHRSFQQRATRIGGGAGVRLWERRPEGGAMDGWGRRGGEASSVRGDENDGRACFMLAWTGFSVVGSGNRIILEIFVQVAPNGRSTVHCTC